MKNKRINERIYDFLGKKTSYFNNYEKIWLIVLAAISVVLSIVFPEETVNGFDGRLITILYLIDVILCLFCELLTSKQSKWSFFWYIFVEIIEIAVLLMLKARFATLAVSIFLWMPLHIASFINWHKHPDKAKKELTVVRQLKWWQSIIICALVVAWTFGIGYLTAAYGPETDFYHSETIIKVIAYLDACVSAVGIADGILLFFRYKEAWTIWYISIALECIINILSGQWVLLVLKVGYLSNTTYGLLTWSKYIKNHENLINNSQTENAELAENNEPQSA